MGDRWTSRSEMYDDMPPFTQMDSSPRTNTSKVAQNIEYPLLAVVVVVVFLSCSCCTRDVILPRASSLYPRKFYHRLWRARSYHVWVCKPRNGSVCGPRLVTMVSDGVGGRERAGQGRAGRGWVTAGPMICNLLYFVLHPSP